MNCLRAVALLLVAFVMGGAFSSRASAQESLANAAAASYRGLVIDASGAPVPDADILRNGRRTGLKSGPDGRFDLPFEEADDYEPPPVKTVGARVVGPGYFDEGSVDIVPGANLANLVISLKHASSATLTLIVRDANGPGCRMSTHGAKPTAS